MPSQALDAHRPPHFLERLLDTPNLPQVVRDLDPQILHRLVQVVGLEDCGEIVSLATPAQLTRIFDVDVWRSDRPGDAERFDADRFGLWLEVLVESGVSNAAQKVAGLDFDFVTSALAEHFVVIDQASETAAAILRQFVNDGDEQDLFERPSIIERVRAGGLGCEVAGYAVAAKRSASWDAILAVLAALDDEHPDFLRRMMSRCCQLSAKQIDDSGGLYELLNASEQVRSDVAFERERRREGQGYVAASQAVAFLQSARRVGLRADSVPPRDDVTRAYFRDLERQPRWSEPAASAPVQDSETSNRSHSGMASFMETLREAGVVTDPPRRLLAEGNDVASDRASRLTALMQVVYDRNEDAFTRRNEELVYLANVLASGCRFNSGRFSHADVQDAVVATCNLGLENWPRQWLPAPPRECGPHSNDGEPAVPADFLLHQDLVTVFRAGWTVLYEEVVVYVTRRLMEILSQLSSRDSALQDDLGELCRRLRWHLSEGTPWRVGDFLDVIAILDTPSWALLVRLIDECPAVPRDLDPPAGSRLALRVPTDFTFISENQQIAWVRRFVERLPGSLRE